MNSQTFCLSCRNRTCSFSSFNGESQQLFYQLNITQEQCDATELTTKIQGQCGAIELTTRTQRETDTWYQQCQVKLTASSFHSRFDDKSSISSFRSNC